MPSATATPRPAAAGSPPGARVAGIEGVGAALPGTAIPNARIAARLGVDDEWISSRTGVRERRVAGPGDSLAALAAAAGAAALERGAASADELDLVLVATSTADELLPNAAPLVAERIGAKRAAAIDVGAACTGFLGALELGAGAVESGRAASALVIGADLMTRLTDFDDRRTAGLFGDGAGAALVRAGGRAAIGPLRLRSDGAGRGLVRASHGERKVRMDGRATFRAAVARLSETTLEVVAAAGIELGEIDLFVYHQANSRILASVGERLGLAPERVVDSLALYGNTSAASIPIALDAALADGRLADGSRVLLGAFGAGLTWGAGIVEWGAAR